MVFWDSWVKEEICSFVKFWKILTNKSTLIDGVMGYFSVSMTGFLGLLLVHRHKNWGSVARNEGGEIGVK